MRLQLGSENASGGNPPKEKICHDAAGLGPSGSREKPCFRAPKAFFDVLYRFFAKPGKKRLAGTEEVI